MCIVPRSYNLYLGKLHLISDKQNNKKLFFLQPPKFTEECFVFYEISALSGAKNKTEWSLSAENLQNSIQFYNQASLDTEILKYIMKKLSLKFSDLLLCIVLRSYMIYLEKFHLSSESKTAKNSFIYYHQNLLNF